MTTTSLVVIVLAVLSIWNSGFWIGRMTAPRKSTHYHNYRIEARGGGAQIIMKDRRGTRG